MAALATFVSAGCLKSRLLETRKTKAGLMLDLSHLNISTLDLSQLFNKKQVKGQDRAYFQCLHYISETD